MTNTLYAFDSANFGLAVRDTYNVAFHQPQPPGYPLYVFIARALNVAVQDANRALIIEGVLLSAIAVGSTLVLVRALFGRFAAVLAGLLLLFTVGFWGYGEVAYAYVGLAAESATLALLAHLVRAGRHRLLPVLGVAVAVAGGIRWDGAVFALPLWLWALYVVPSWRLRVASLGAAAIVVCSGAVPMIQLTGGWAVYVATVGDYLRVWAPQSAYVAGEPSSGGATLVTYNLNFFIDYSRQMLGVGLVVALYVLARRLGPAALVTDDRNRLLALWIAPPILVDIFTHLGEPGYLLALAPAAATLAALGVLELAEEILLMGAVLRARGVACLPAPQVLARATIAVLMALIVGWNVQAFLRGVGPGRLPDLRARDATTTAQVAFLREQPLGSTLVLAHDTVRQIQYYLPEVPRVLMYSEYVPNWETVLERTDIPNGVRQVVVLDGPLSVEPVDQPRVRGVTLLAQPVVEVWVVDVTGLPAIEHGYRTVRLTPA